MLILYFIFKFLTTTYCNNCSATVLTTGENNPSWNPNKTDEERLIGRHTQYDKQFVKKVLKRDHYTCQCCGKHSGSLIVHHLDGYNWCKDKRYDETNGITLCKNCHKNFHMEYGRGNNTKEQFESWLGQAVELLKYNGVKYYLVYDDIGITDCMIVGLVPANIVNYSMNKLQYNTMIIVSLLVALFFVSVLIYFALRNKEKLRQKDNMILLRDELFTYLSINLRTLELAHFKSRVSSL